MISLKELIANYCVDFGFKHTMSGNYIIEFETISKLFGVSVNWIRENQEEISQLIDSHDEVIGPTWTEKDTNESAFNMNFCINNNEEDW